MIHTTQRASQLATRIVNAAILRASVPSLRAPSPFLIATSRYLSTLTLKPPTKRTSLRSQISTAKQQTRQCSYRRAMCNGNADMPGGSVDVDAHREVLPKNVKPLHYDLTLEPNFESFKYEGKVVIEYV